MIDGAKDVLLRAFHGTSLASYDSIAAHGFRESANSHDWAGDGVYFFLEARRAVEWATRRHGARATVVEVEIRSDAVLDLSSDEEYDLLVAASRQLLVAAEQLGVVLGPTARGSHRSDRVVVNHLVAELQKRGRDIDAVRVWAATRPPAYAGCRLAPPQIGMVVVRNVRCIQRVRQWVP